MWKREIDKRVRDEGLSRQKNGLEKETPACYTENVAPKYKV